MHNSDIRVLVFFAIVALLIYAWRRLDRRAHQHRPPSPLANF